MGIGEGFELFVGWTVVFNRVLEGEHVLFVGGVRLELGGFELVELVLRVLFMFVFASEEFVIGHLVVAVVSTFGYGLWGKDGLGGGGDEGLDGWG